MDTFSSKKLEKAETSQLLSNFAVKAQSILNEKNQLLADNISKVLDTYPIETVFLLKKIPVVAGITRVDILIEVLYMRMLFEGVDEGFYESFQQRHNMFLETGINDYLQQMIEIVLNLLSHLEADFDENEIVSLIQEVYKMESNKMSDEMTHALASLQARMNEVTQLSTPVENIISNIIYRPNR